MLTSSSCSQSRSRSRSLTLATLEDRLLLAASDIVTPNIIETATQSSNAVAGNDVHVADMDGDGRDDVVRRADGDWLISRSAGGGAECQLAGSDTSGIAALPTRCVDSLVRPRQDQAPIRVPAGGDLQAAIDAALPGDIIELEAGATYSGRFTFPPKAGDGWIHIRGSRHGQLPPAGTRIDPSQHAHLLPKIVGIGSGGAGRAIDILAGAHHLRFEGIEITTDHEVTNTVVTNLVVLNAIGTETEADLPHHIIFDRTYIHGTPRGSVLNGVRVDGRHVAVIDSYLSDFHARDAESHAIYAADGAGPIKIDNNYLEAAGINVMFGGDDPVIHGLVNEDIEIRGNLFSKQQAWRSTYWSHKFLLDLKNARRVLVTENIFENSWRDDRFSDGSAIIFKSTNQDGGCDWCVVEDITMTRNIVRNVAKGVKIAGHVNGQSERTKRILIANNLFYDMDSSAPGGGSAIALDLLDDYDDVYFVHNTTITSGQTAIAMRSDLSPARHGLNLVVKDNLLSHNIYGVKGSGTQAGTATLDAWTADYVFTHNVIFGNPSIDASSYPPNNHFPATVDFVSSAQDNYRLAADSPFAGAATNGSNVGVDYDAINALACVQDGRCIDRGLLVNEIWGRWSDRVLWDDVQAADINGDGKDDVVGRTDGQWWVARSNGTAFVTEYWGRWSNTADWADVHVADVNGDGLDDIVGRANGQWWVARSTGTAFATNYWGRWSNSVDWNDVRAADVNGDGRADIVGRANGQWWVARSTGRAFITEYWGHWSKTANWDDVLVADLDGDGDHDIIGRANGVWWAARSNGRRFVTEFWGHWSNAVTWNDVQVADVDSDGKDDIVGRANGQWWVSRSDGDGFVTKFWGRWSDAVTWSHVQTADLNGDGKDDIIGRADDQWWAAISVGNYFVSEYWGS